MVFVNIIFLSDLIVKTQMMVWRLMISTFGELDVFI